MAVGKATTNGGVAEQKKKDVTRGIFKGIQAWVPYPRVQVQVRVKVLRVP